MIRACIPLLLLACLGVAAQEPAKVLETIVVTASRTPIAVGASGSDVTVITRADLESRQLPYLADVLREIPGFAVSRSGPFGTQTQVRVRGAEANHVLVLIDGVEANDPALGDEFQFEHLATADIERVEIVRGPQSALWGSDAIAGVINVITRRGGDGAVDARFEGGTYDTRRAEAGASLGDDVLGARLSAAYFDTAGTNIARSGSERDGYRNGTLNVTAHASPGDATRLEFSLRHTDAVSDLDSIDSLTGLPTDADREAGATQSYLSAAAKFAPAARVEHDLKLTYLETDTDNFAAGAEDGDFAADKVGVYYQANLALSSTQAVTLAVDHERSRFQQRGEATPFGDPNQNQMLATSGYVVEYRASPGDALDFSAALRHDASSEFRGATTYRFAASYALPTGRTHLRASIATGQKAPTFIDRFGYFPDVFAGNAALKPETSRGWEIGVDRTLARHMLARLTYFDQRLEDEIDPFVFDPNLGVFTAVNRSDKSYRRGVELAISAQPTRALGITASYTYTDSTAPDAAGMQRPELRRPRNVAAVNFDYALSARAHLDLDVLYTGERFDTFYPPFPEPPATLELGSYRLVNLASRFALGPRLELLARIENLLDADYEDVIGYATPGRALYVGLRASR